ncbi:Ig-like domain repeat protein [Galbitalea sp. SE-J8]|uniref:Ig-like domain repeat protein n=1 Tax=Galbitalea sp. SE-J8 TaxID=3054952 RepID=UPI00259D29FA|nr:Ig-like domain repeat protein [Galbitalea sp. SE-J8]MDM4762255.1 Ig-like domain repeat protein [Galbitalea sp. SE-J8]
MITSRPDAAQRRRHLGRRVGVLALSASLLASAAVAGGVATAQAVSSIDTEKPLTVLLGVGADESQRIASWYFHDGTPQALEIEKTSDLSAGAFNGKKRVIAAATAANTAADASTGAKQVGYYNSHATIDGLQPNTTYSYHVGAADHWSPTYTITTKSFSGDYDFLFFGDPQIGSSGDAVEDGVGWAATLNYATSVDPQAELLVSGGDQIEVANNEDQWAQFADQTDVLKRYPWASTIGNHDVGGKAYEQHNTLPNNLKNADYYPGGATSTNSGGDYWYFYKDVLFIDINSNAYAGGADAAHVNFIKGVVGKVGQRAKWTVLVYHHSIYSPADHANDLDNQQRRYDFTTAFSKLGIDLVLQGHDHSYTRSYAILNGHKANPDEQPAQPEVFSGPGGVIYVTANSASGSKYYDLTKPDASQSDYGPDPLDPTGQRHWANSVENQEHVRTYVQVGVTDDKLNVQTVRAGDCAAPNSAVELNRTTKPGCGVTLAPVAIDPVTGAVSGGDAAPVGSLVDHFSLFNALPANTVSLSTSTDSVEAGSAATVTLAATVGGGLGAQTGSVTFYDGGTVLGALPLANGSASLTIPSSLAIGVHALTAKFSTGSLFTGADTTSAAAALTVTAPPEPPATTPTKPVKKVASKTTVKWSKSKVTVTVKATGQKVAGSAKVFDGSKKVKTVKITKGKGTAKLKLKKGTHKLKATFVATTKIAASTSRTIRVRAF